ncbi:MAG: hypothetical protein KGL95_14380 [Patescibacteria group bacterium]|nr:hypothetical protein [Patescibacteria group bacterium]
MKKLTCRNYNKNNLRKLAVVQCIPSDLHASKDPRDYCISTLKESGIVDSIVLAVPLIEEHSVFDELGKKWGVDVYYGSWYNIVERICNASEKYNPDIIVRCLLRRFYLDTNLVKSMINKINEGYDYI